MSRILTALVGVPIFYVIIKYLPPFAFLIVVMASVALACRELFDLAARRGIRPHRAIGTILAMGVAYTFFDTRFDTLEAVVLSVVMIAAATILRGAAAGDARDEENPQGTALIGSGVTLAAVLFIGLLLGFPLALLGDGGERGRDLTVLLFLVVWLADAAAFAIGSAWGKRRLVPSISPAKTLEGVAGALCAAVVTAFAARQSFFTGLSATDAIAIGLLLGTTGILGDLFESMMKRAALAKDSGGIFPGHGGMLDRTDSLLFAAPALFYYHRIFMA